MVAGLAFDHQNDFWHSLDFSASEVRRWVLIQYQCVSHKFTDLDEWMEKKKLGGDAGRSNVAADLIGETCYMVSEFSSTMWCTVLAQGFLLTNKYQQRNGAMGWSRVCVLRVLCALRVELHKRAKLWTYWLSLPVWTIHERFQATRTEE